MTIAPPADARLFDTLRSVFGYTRFRPLQEEIVRTILQDRDVFVLMPTGGGKSLCYQLPALLRDGLTVVVSPLIALMKDQVDALTALGAPATFINSSLDGEEALRRQRAVARGEVKLLYVAPERLMLPGFLRLLEATNLTFVAVDEAHCISEWGHDFRPEYRELKKLRGLFPQVQIGAFTATATARVQRDIVGQLGLQQAGSFRGSFNRANLVYEVRPKRDAYGQLRRYLRGRRDVSGIIYCQSRAGTESVASRLQADGFSAVAYHAGLEPEERRSRQEAFVRDDVRIVVATVAFGMGIDKPDVRFVVHYDLPKNLEGYYQESGRAGRDGEPSDCILFYSYGDVAKYQRFIDEKSTAQEQQIARRQLKQMAEWAAGESCRRRALLAYFDERFAGQEGPCCDVCRDPAVQFELVDCTEEAKVLFQCARLTGQQFGSAHLIEVLRGSKSERLLKWRHDQLPVYGAGSARSADEWRQIVDGLLREGYVWRSEKEYNALKLRPKARGVLEQDERVRLPITGRRSGRTDEAAAYTGEHSELFEALRVLRKQIADERRVPPYVIFPDATLRQMANQRPGTLQQLKRLRGVGEHKAAELGRRFLFEIARYVKRTGAQPEESAPEPTPLRPQSRARPRGAAPGETVRATLELFNQGYGPHEIAESRGLSAGTIEQHLVQAIEAGEDVSLDRLLPERKRLAIETAISMVGADYLNPIMERLGDGFSYSEIRYVRAAMTRGS
jgi:ATP-dependent DNA helicase RecQ